MGDARDGGGIGSGAGVEASVANRRGFADCGNWLWGCSF